jgi:hypothetical protein
MLELRRLSWPKHKRRLVFHKASAIMNSATESTWRVGSCSSSAGAETIGISELGSYDVICGRDKQAYHNVGNRRFRVLVAMNKGRYAIVGTRAEKTAIVRYLVQAVMRNGGRFLQRKHQDSWIELDLKKSMAKVGHAIRDIATSKPVPSVRPTAAASAVVPSLAPATVVASGLGRGHAAPTAQHKHCNVEVRKSQELVAQRFS